MTGHMSGMRGDGWKRCCICGDLHEYPYPNLHRDHHGQMWDVCTTHCAGGAPTRKGT